MRTSFAAQNTCVVKNAREQVDWHSSKRTQSVTKCANLLKGVHHSSEKTDGVKTTGITMKIDCRLQHVLVNF